MGLTPTYRKRKFAHVKDDKLEPFMQEAVMSFGEAGGRCFYEIEKSIRLFKKVLENVIGHKSS